MALSVPKSVRVALSLTLILVACTSDESRPEVSIESFAEVLIESVWTGDLSFGVDSAIADCMRESGFEVVVEPRTEPGQTSAAPGLPDEEYVALYGYGVVEQPPEVVQDAPSFDEDPFQRAYIALPLDEQSAFAFAYGGSEDAATVVPGAGCRGAVLGTIEEPATESRLSETLSLLDDYQRRVDSDDRVVRARAGWTSCMAENGFPGLVDSMSVFNDLFSQLQAPDADREDVRRLELRMAAADFACVQDTFEVTSVVEAELAPQFAEEAAELLLADE